MAHKEIHAYFLNANLQKHKEELRNLKELRQLMLTLYQDINQL